MTHSYKCIKLKRKSILLVKIYFSYLIINQCIKHSIYMENTKRFSNRVDDYVKYRPGYPPELINYLRENISENSIIADIGSGTGILTEMLLKAGFEIIAVEPNNEMLERSKEILASYKKLSFTKGTAEDTMLPDNCVDGIVAAQAFHWFDRKKAKNEFKRILKPGGFVSLIWNERLVKSEFEIEYEQLIENFSTDYSRVDHRNITDGEIDNFFAPHPVILKIFTNYQEFDFEGLKGRLQSSSYMPLPGDERYDGLVKTSKLLFKKYQNNGLIKINYDTKMYIGKI